MAQFGTGQQLTAYNSLIFGPKNQNENDGPEHMYVILLDNDRSELYQTKPQSKALTCIRCGACLNACPIYKNVGGHAYQTPYTGPIGSVITPVLRGKAFDHLADACTLCGKCTEACPVKIPLHELILYNRNQTVQHKNAKMWNRYIKIFRLVGKEQNKMDMFSVRFKNIIFKLFKNKWGKYRSLPNFAPQSFSEYWRKKA